MKGSNNNFLRKRRESWPRDSINGRVDFHWQDGYNSRQYLIGFLALRYKSSHREPTPTGRGDK